MTTEDKDAEIERLKGYLERANWRHCDIPACNCNGYHNWNPSREEIEEPLREEVERLKGELAEAVRLLGEAEDVVPSADYTDGERQALYETFGRIRTFRLKHAPPMNCDSAPCEHKRVNQGVLGDEGYVVMCLDCGVDLTLTHTPPLNCGSAAAGESPSHSGGGETL